MQVLFSCPHGGGEAQWQTAVSYTHLDVYKRQDLHIGTDSEGGYLVPDEFVRL